MATVHEVSSEGDVKLICGSEETSDAMHIIVSSVVLRHGSPVFKAMLGSHFKEGHTLATGARLDLPLPDDDAASLLTICQTMHMRPVIPGVQTSEAFLKLAILINKYDCEDAFAYQTIVWLKGKSLRKSDSDRLHLFISAYLLDSPVEFSRWGRNIVLHSQSIILSENLPGLDGSLKSVIDKLAAQTRSLRGRVADLVDRSMENEFMGSDSLDGSPGDCPYEFCSYVAQRSNRFMKALMRSDLWPITSIAGRPLHYICEAMLHFSSGWAEDLSLCGNEMCRGLLMAKDEDVVAEMEVLVKQLRAQAIEPCLTCVKQGHVQAEARCEKGH